MDGVNTDKLFEALEVEFEDKVDQKSSNNTECLIRLDDGNTDHAEKFVQPSEMEARTKCKNLDCQKLNDCAIRLQSENDRWLEFSNHRNQERVPFVVYADLEWILRKTEPDKVDVLTSYAYQRHEAFSIGYYVHCSYDNSLSSYSFPNCVKLRFIYSYKFLNASLDKLASYLDKDKLNIVRSEFSTVSDEEFELLIRKGIFPYEYIDYVE
ncbi:hypothetical protein ALC57_01215 [Trachymyrmex cornetzi]|uniref:Uncharacterized protein n=1 Tax=Trachymyrmex cornetzi TaxID=471704 RepID=A0A151JQJ4_9HYME|nr:hypothetical protein ALC57_01215 [Trachymyrmex cornetzi]